MNNRVLLVDDSLTVRMDLKDAFDAAEFNTVPCSTLEEAWRALEGAPPALIILDVLLPDGDGVEFLKKLRTGSLHSDVPVVLLSSETEIRDRVRGLKTGANEYVGKPYDIGYLLARSRELIQRSLVSEVPSAPTVLIIDDSRTFLEELRRALEAADYRVLQAPDGEEGLRLAGERRPDAIIVDGVLPVADGATVIRRIRLDAALRQTPCLLLTASDEVAAELRAFEAGADAFVRKGEDFSILLARLGALLRTRVQNAGIAAAVSLSAPKKILAIDESDAFLNQLSEELRGEGYDVVCARSGEESLELLAIQTVDCILLDLLGGVRQGGGFALCRMIKAAPTIRELPLVLLSSREDRCTMVEGLGAGADDFIPKSSGWDVIKARVLAQIRRRQVEDENRRFREQFVHLEREAAATLAAKALAETRAALNAELELKNRELEAFSYSVSHDLRTPLRAIDGFSLAALEACEDSSSRTAQYLTRVRTAAGRMSELIDDLLKLSSVTRGALTMQRLDVTGLARAVAAELARTNPGRDVDFIAQEGLVAHADWRMLRIILENLLGNAWKFTSKRARARIEVGVTVAEGRPALFVRDDGAGFDPEYAERLFTPFQRLHEEKDFPGTGIGLATVHRIVERHRGRVWAEAKPGQGATFFLELPPA